jgi:hypothetical protein
VKLTHKGGGLRLRFEPMEVSLLSSLLTQLGAIVADGDPDDPVAQRLYPSVWPSSVVTWTSATPTTPPGGSRCSTTCGW